MNIQRGLLKIGGSAVAALLLAGAVGAAQGAEPWRTAFGPDGFRAEVQEVRHGHHAERHHHRRGQHRYHAPRFHHFRGGHRYYAPPRFGHRKGHHRSRHHRPRHGYYRYGLWY